MKFISKNSNLHIILQPGQPANPVTQTPPVPALSVRFINGQADISDENIANKMLRHSAFNQDFILVDDVGTDPYAHMRAASEPQHVTTEIKFGHPTGRNVPPVSTPLPPELKKLITEQATAIAAEMVKAQTPALIEEALKALVAAQASTPTEPTPVVSESEKTVETSTVVASNKAKLKGQK